MLAKMASSTRSPTMMASTNCIPVASDTMRFPETRIRARRRTYATSARSAMPKGGILLRPSEAIGTVRPMLGHWLLVSARSAPLLPFHRQADLRLPHRLRPALAELAHRPLVLARRFLVVAKGSAAMQPQRRQHLLLIHPRGTHPRIVQLPLLEHDGRRALEDVPIAVLPLGQPSVPVA